jgi:hypothetical protein
MTRIHIGRIGVTFGLVLCIAGCDTQTVQSDTTQASESGDVALGKSDCKWRKLENGKRDLKCKTSKEVIVIDTTGTARCDSTGMGVGC